MIVSNEIPFGSVLGLNYSGMHDSAIAIVAPDGAVVFAAALERFSRVKQDGRPPFALIESLPWDRISKIAVSTEKALEWPQVVESKLLPTKLQQVRPDGLRHAQAFYDFLENLPCEKEYVCHQLAHAASAFWGSEFDDALCLTYDGGMCNSPWFGGLYVADRQNGIRPLEQFSALHYAKVTSLYTFVTALLGFSPNKHEGKITGLAAYGQPTDPCRALLRRWFEEEFLEIEGVMDWVFTYDEKRPPALLTNEARIERFRKDAAHFSREEMAAAVQEFAENHIVGLLHKARESGWVSNNICLAGGLFANVKINQRVVETGFKGLFVAPPMTDDGTALGAAWHVLSRQPGFAPKPLHSMYSGPSFSSGEIEGILSAEKVRFERLGDPESTVASLLATGSVVAVFQGGMEFGPRALGNRSILAQATREEINQSLNSRLNRTEFMPFAPISRIEDAAACYQDIGPVLHAAEFMTVTVNCTAWMREACPAVVHVDGTARPQLVSAQSNPFVHRVLSQYQELTGKPALVNTSFNIHEEPIVCSPIDALRGFFESGLDYLYLGDGVLVSLEQNAAAERRFLRDKQRQPSLKSELLSLVVSSQSKLLLEKETQLAQKERVIQEKEAAILTSAAHLVEKDEVVLKQLELILALQAALKSRSAAIKLISFLYRVPVLREVMHAIKRGIEILSPRLGNLNQYVPRPLSQASRVMTRPVSQTYPTISIVTPSYQQAAFIERTLKSVLAQGYPNLEYVVQDGGSTDGTPDILALYGQQLAGWRSERDGGQSHALNLGFANTSGEIMAWLNSDDVLLPDTLATVAEFFNNHPEVDVVYGNRLLIDENDMEIGRWIMPWHDSQILSWVDYVPQETLFWRRRIWDKAGGQIDESFRFAMDWDLLVRFREAGATFAHIPRFMGAFRIHKHQKTSAVMDEIGHQEMNRIRERVLGRVPDRKEIRKATFPFLLKHVAVDMGYRIKTRLRGKR